MKALRSTRVGLACAGACIALAASSGDAVAATAFVYDGGDGTSALQIDDDVGQPDSMLIRYDQSTSEFVITDFGPGITPTFNTSCQSDGPSVVRCGDANVVYVGVNLEAGDDRLEVEGSGPEAIPILQMAAGGGAGSDHIFAATGGNTLATANVLNGGPGADEIHGGGAKDLIFGDDANNGSDGADLLYGARGNDLILGGLGNDDVYGQGGNDRLGSWRPEGIPPFIDRGRDAFLGGGGRDKIDARDFRRDAVIRCGGGDDRRARRDSSDPRPRSC